MTRFKFQSFKIFLLFCSQSSSESEAVSLTAVNEEDICFLRDQTSLPYLPWEDDFSNKEIAKYLLNPPGFAICKDRPAVCQRNAVFVIDREVLASDDDLKCDDFSWRNNVTKPVNVSLGSQTYVLNRTYFLHRKYKDFKRRIHTITRPDGTEGRYVMVVYRFAEAEHPVTPNKKSRMQPSTITAMKKKLKTGKSSRDVYMEARQEAGGLSATNVSARPRTINQVQKLKGRSTQNQTSTARSGQKDELYSVIVKCIEDSSNPDRFIQFVQGAPQPLAFLADARQLNDVERFCTNSRKPGILSIDTTYNSGEFYVTPTTYRHRLLLSKRTGKYPVLLGPTLIHKHRDKEAFSYLASSMTRLKPSLGSILAIGCDRDKAVKNGLAPHFPCAVFLACKKHFEDDIQRKLTELGLNGNERRQIVADILGSEVTQERGLIDRSSELDFDRDLAELEQVWNDREKEARATSVPEFHSWFVRYQAQDVKEMLLYPVRRDIGLGYDFYYNNDPESVHRNIKSRQNYKATEMPTVVENIRKEKDANLCYVEDAIIGNGPFELAPEAAHFQVDQYSWTYQWSEGKRKKHLQKFNQALSTGPSRLPTATQETQDSNEVEEAQMESEEVHEVEDKTACEETGEKGDQTSTTVSLSVSFCETGLSVVFLPSYKKAANLFLDETLNIVKAPGNHEGFLVASDSEATPYFVAVKENGACICQCRGFKSASLCSHSLAVADHTIQLDQFLSWFHSRGGPNITAAASATAPANTGKKPGQKSRVRKTRNRGTSRNDDSYVDRRPYIESASVENEQRYHFKWLDKTTARVCYGCGGKLRSTDSPVPSPPFDMVVSTKEYRRWYDKSSQTTKITKKPEATHYHVNPTCVSSKNAAFKASLHLSITAEDRQRMLDVHKNFLKETLNITVL